MTTVPYSLKDSPLETPMNLLAKLLLINIVFLAGSSSSVMAQAASRPRHPHTLGSFAGGLDTEFVQPRPEGKIGEKDPSAMAELTKMWAASGLPEKGVLRMDGTFTHEAAEKPEHLRASISLAGGRRFRLDIHEKHGDQSIRMNDQTGRSGQSSEDNTELEDLEFVNPLAYPFMLQEVAAGENVAVVDDGFVNKNTSQLHKINVTAFKTKRGTPVAAVFYINTATHELQKASFTEHSAGQRALLTNIVVTYDQYLKEGTVMVPHYFSETLNGLLTTTFTVESVAVIDDSDDQRFVF